MKSALSVGISRFRVKGTLKFVLVLLFGFSLLFLSYQLINYSNLTSYQSLESHRFLSSKNSKPAAGGYRSLKDIAYHLEEDKHRVSKDKEGHRNLKPEPSIQSKGDIGSFGGGSVHKRRGKPVFSATVLGVAPEAQKYYIKQQQKNRDFFNCFGSAKLITWDKFNDDFCDCPLDGSDEPSTAACMNGRFFCSAYKKGYPEYIPSSMVNDGVCDCVDGSDEHERTQPISCKNRS